MFYQCTFDLPSSQVHLFKTDSCVSGKKMSFEYFEAESHVLTYSQFRPSPPKELIEKIINFTKEKVSKMCLFDEKSRRQSKSVHHVDFF